MTGRPINALELYSRIKGEWDKTSQPLRERATILPFGQYEDGSVGMAFPGILAAPAEGMVNFGRYGYDTPEAIRDNAASAFDVAGGAVTGGLGLGLAGGLADDALRAAPRAARLTESATPPANLSAELSQKRAGIMQTIQMEEHRAQQLLAGKEGWQRAYGSQALERAAALRERVKEIDSGSYVEPKRSPILDEEELFQPPPFDPSNAVAPTQTPGGFLAYRGVQNADQMVNGPIKDVKPQHFAWWGTADPEVAGLFAGQRDRAATIPAEVRFKNPLEIDAQGSDWRIPRGNGFALTDEIVEAARRGGNDGVIFKNIREGDQGEYPLSTTFAAIRPGTVYSATTGNLIYNNAPTGAAIPLSGEAQDNTDPALLQYLRAVGLY